MANVSSGVREVYEVFSILARTKREPRWALSNRRILFEDSSKVWALSPDDGVVGDFLFALEALMPTAGQTRRCLATLSPNQVSVVLWIDANGSQMLLGADLERNGWNEVIEKHKGSDSRASVFKLPHHGSANAHHEGVWTQMLDTNVKAVLTPWQRGGYRLPRSSDTKRILSLTEHAYSSSQPGRRSGARRRSQPVERTIRESGIKLMKARRSSGMVRFRKPMGEAGEWRVELFGTACHLKDVGH